MERLLEVLENVLNLLILAYMNPVIILTKVKYIAVLVDKKDISKVICIDLDWHGHLTLLSFVVTSKEKRLGMVS